MNAKKLQSVATKMARKSGLINLTQAKLCEQAGLPAGSFAHVAGCSFTDFVDAIRVGNPDLETGVPGSRARTNPTLRRDQILQGALEVAKTDGFNKLTRDNVAKANSVSVGLVTHYFGTMTQLRRAVMRAAIQGEVVEVIAQGLANGDETAKKAPTELKEKAVAHLAL